MSGVGGFSGVHCVNDRAHHRRMTSCREDGKIQRTDARQRRKRQGCTELAGGFASRRLEVEGMGPNDSKFEGAISMASRR